MSLWLFSLFHLLLLLWGPPIIKNGIFFYSGELKTKEDHQEEFGFQSLLNFRKQLFFCLAMVSVQQQLLVLLDQRNDRIYSRTWTSHFNLQNSAVLLHFLSFPHFFWLWKSVKYSLTAGSPSVPTLCRICFSHQQKWCRPLSVNDSREKGSNRNTSPEMSPKVWYGYVTELHA